LLGHTSPMPRVKGLINKLVSLRYQNFPAFKGLIRYRFDIVDIATQLILSSTWVWRTVWVILVIRKNCFFESWTRYFITVLFIVASCLTRWCPGWGARRRGRCGRTGPPCWPASSAPRSPASPATSPWRDRHAGNSGTIRRGGHWLLSSRIDTNKLLFFHHGSTLQNRYFF